MLNVRLYDQSSILSPYAADHGLTVRQVELAQGVRMVVLDIPAADNIAVIDHILRDGRGWPSPMTTCRTGAFRPKRSPPARRPGNSPSRYTTLPSRPFRFGSGRRPKWR